MRLTGGSHGNQTSCDDAQTRDVVASRMQPANDGSLHATLQNYSYWQRDVDQMVAAASISSPV